MLFLAYILIGLAYMLLRTLLCVAVTYVFGHRVQWSAWSFVVSVLIWPIDVLWFIGGILVVTGRVISRNITKIRMGE